MTADDVRHTLGEGAPTQVVLPDGTRASVEEYARPEGVLRVEYDGLANRNNARVALVSQPLRQTYETVTALVKRLGEPSAGGDALVQGLQTGAVVWVDPKCDAVLSYYRRNASWFADEVSTFLRVERLSRLPVESPASAAVQEYLADPSPPDEDVASDGAVASVTTAETAYDSPPRRTEYSRPVYPAGARQLGVKGVVMLHLTVERSGRVADAKVTQSEPAGYGFEEAAIEAAKRWKFAPASRNGRPVDGEVDIVVRFR
jgi:TonB family protein